MSIIRKITPHLPEARTSLKGVVNSECTYEIAEDMLILRTSSKSTIHMSKEAARTLVKIIVDELL